MQAAPMSDVCDPFLQLFRGDVEALGTMLARLVQTWPLACGAVRIMLGDTVVRGPGKKRSQSHAIGDQQRVAPKFGAQDALHGPRTRLPAPQVDAGPCDTAYPATVCTSTSD